jgi:hypothetical protein
MEELLNPPHHSNEAGDLHWGESPTGDKKTKDRVEGEDEVGLTEQRYLGAGSSSSTPSSLYASTILSPAVSRLVAPPEFQDVDDSYGSDNNTFFKAPMSPSSSWSPSPRSAETCSSHSTMPPIVALDDSFGSETVGPQTSGKDNPAWSGWSLLVEETKPWVDSSLS